MGSPIDLSGQRFERLLVLSKTDKRIKNGSIIWMCKCDCGNIHFAALNHLKNGNTKSCGCLNKENRAKYGLVKTHGETKTRFYRIWGNLRNRCKNMNNHAYKYYGDRGIGVCERWNSFENFKKDMYESYLDHVKEHGEKQTTIDRVDNNKDYTPENCKWATYKEQRNNQSIYKDQREFHAISPTGDFYTSLDQHRFAREHNLNPGHINNCLCGRNKTHKGWIFMYEDELRIL